MLPESIYAKMGTLLHQSVLPSYTHVTIISPWIPREVPALNQPTALLPLPSKRTYTARAQGRGFGVPVAKDKKKKPEITDSQINQSEVDPDDEIPQEVFDRMIRRVLLYVGAPIATGIGLLYALNQLKDHGVIDVPAWLPLLTILVTFGTSGLGIAFGTISSSWDPEVEGSLLGFEEAKKNWAVLWKEEDKR